MKNVKCVICGGRTYNRRKTCSDECFALRQKELTNTFNRRPAGLPSFNPDREMERKAIEDLMGES